MSHIAIKVMHSWLQARKRDTSHVFAIMNSRMQVTVTKEDKNISTIELETKPGRALKAYEQTLRQLSNNLNLPGFRKGKIPAKMVESHYGAEYIKSQTVNLNFVSELLFEAFIQEKLEVLFVPNIETIVFEDPAGTVKVKAKIELFPEVKLGKYKGKEVEVEIHEFDEKQYLSETLERVQKQFANHAETTEAVAMGDEIVFDFTGEVNKGTKKKPEWEAKPEMAASQYQTTVETGRFIPNFLEQIVGMKAGEEKDIEVKFPDDYHAADLAGKDTKFKIKVHQVLRPQLPEINDELAKRVNFESLDDLKAKVIEEMNKVQDQNKKAASAEAVLKLVSELSEIEINEQMIEREIQTGLDRVAKQNRWSAEQVEEFKQSIDLDKERKAAEENLRKSFIISSIIKEEKLDATEAEVDAAVQEALSSPYNDFQNLDLSKLKSSVRSQLISDKAVKLLVDECKLKFKAHVHGPSCGHNH